MRVFIIMVSRNRSRQKVDSSSSGSHDSDEGHMPVKQGDFLGRYKVQREISDGTFGRVVQASFQDKYFAIKIIRAVKRYTKAAQQQKQILVDLNKFDGEDKKGIVRFIEAFKHGRNYCMVFQRLGISLFNLLRQNDYRGYPIHYIQKIAKQLLETVGFLHQKQLTHTDLKPQNICFVDTKLIHVKKGGKPDYYLPHSTKVKLIDFGGATYEHQPYNSLINTRQYRAPEVILRCCSWNHLSDIWGLACILIQLYTGNVFFKVHDNLEHLAMIGIAAGPFPEWMAKKSNQFAKNFRPKTFDRNFVQFDWPESARNREQIKNVQKFKTLKDLIRTQHREFRMLLKNMLQIDPKVRGGCKQLLKSGFFQVRY